MKLAKQAPPVKRSIHRAAELGDGVRAAGLFDDILGGIKQVADVALPIASTAAPLIASMI